MTTKGFQIDHYQPHGNLNLVGCLALKYSQCSMRVSLINSKNVSFSVALQLRNQKWVPQSQATLSEKWLLRV